MSQKITLLVLSLFSVLSNRNYSAAVPVPEFNVVDFDKLADLEFVHVFYRHGDRNPILQAPGDKYDASYFPEGFGQLTNLGKQQQYALGQWLRKRYQGFLNSTFNVDDIYVQSTDVDRTLMSAKANLAGLYPPTDSQIWNMYLLWQPIPVHSIPNDYLITSRVPETCTSYQTAYNKYLASAEMREFEQSLQPFYDYILAQTGTTINNFVYVMLLRDSWLCQSIHNLSLPEWTHSLYPNNEQFNNAALKFFRVPSATKFLAKFASGFLLKDILDRFTNKTENRLSPNRKFWMYSTHDSTLSNFLNSLNISDNDFVPYAATIILELRRYMSNYYVQIFYKTSDQTPKAIRIPGCGNVCPLSRMYQIYDNILPKYDFSTECQIDET